MGKEKLLELWWQLYRTSLSERDVRNIRSMDFCSTECIMKLHRGSGGTAPQSLSLGTTCGRSTSRATALPPVNEHPVEASWNVMAHAQKPDVFRRNGPVHLNRRGRQFSRLLAASRGVRISGSNAGYTMFWGSAKSTGYSIHSPVFPSLPPARASSCAITFQLESTRLTEGWVEPRTGLDGLEQRQNSYPCRHSKPRKFKPIAQTPVQ